MTRITGKTLAILAVIVGLSCPAWAADDVVQFMSRANAKVARASAHKNIWDGPIGGPKIQKKKKIIFVASDMRNASIVSLSNGVREAATTAGWEVLNIDCRGGCVRGTSIVGQAIGMGADGIILAGIDAGEQAKGLAAAQAAKIPVVGWHSAAKAGPVDGLFTNVSTDLKDVAQIAALFDVVESNGRAGIVVLTDSTNVSSLTKTNAVIEVIKQCQACRLLSVEELTPLQAPASMPALVESLVKRHGAKWTHTIAISDVYFDVMETPKIAAILSTTNVQATSAGDGWASAYQRIRAKKMQGGTVPEPVNLHGWQLIDEINRAMAGDKPSGYSTPVHLVTSQNILYDGGAQNRFDPDNGYRDQYKKIWFR